LPAKRPSRTAARPRPRSRTAPVAGALPSREEVVAFIASGGAAAGAGPKRVTKRDVARAFGVKGDDKGALKALLKSLETEGAIVRGRKVLARQGALPAMVVAEIVERDRDGELIARPVEWNEPGEAPRILVRRPRLRRESAPAPRPSAIGIAPASAAKAPTIPPPMTTTLVAAGSASSGMIEST